MKYWQFPLIILSLILASVFSLAYVRQNRSIQAPAPIFELPQFEFDRTDGSKFSKQNMLGKVSVLSFFFTSCPAICPAVNAEIAKLAENNRQRADLQFVSVSIDADRDSPEKIEKYAERYKADPVRWKFLRGEQKAVDELLSELKLALGPDMSAHTTRLILIDRQAKVLGYYDPFEIASLSELQAHIDILMD